MRSRKTGNRKRYLKPRLRSQRTIERQILGTGGCQYTGNLGPPVCTKNLT